MDDKNKEKVLDIINSIKNWSDNCPFKMELKKKLEVVSSKNPTKAEKQ